MFLSPPSAAAAIAVATGSGGDSNPTVLRECTEAGASAADGSARATRLAAAAAADGLSASRGYVMEADFSTADRGAAAAAEGSGVDGESACQGGIIAAKASLPYDLAPPAAARGFEPIAAAAATPSRVERDSAGDATVVGGNIGTSGVIASAAGKAEPAQAVVIRAGRRSAGGLGADVRASAADAAAIAAAEEAGLQPRLGDEQAAAPAAEGVMKVTAAAVAGNGELPAAAADDVKGGKASAAGSAGARQAAIAITEGTPTAPSRARSRALGPGTVGGAAEEAFSSEALAAAGDAALTEAPAAAGGEVAAEGEEHAATGRTIQAAAAAARPGKGALKLAAATKTSAKPEKVVASFCSQVEMSSKADCASRKRRIRQTHRDPSSGGTYKKPHCMQVGCGIYHYKPPRSLLSPNNVSLTVPAGVATFFSPTCLSGTFVRLRIFVPVQAASRAAALVAAIHGNKAAKQVDIVASRAHGISEDDYEGDEVGVGSLGEAMDGFNTSPVAIAADADAAAVAQAAVGVGEHGEGVTGVKANRAAAAAGDVAAALGGVLTASNALARASEGALKGVGCVAGDSKSSSSSSKVVEVLMVSVHESEVQYLPAIRGVRNQHLLRRLSDGLGPFLGWRIMFLSKVSLCCFWALLNLPCICLIQKGLF
jgi:hypothetical protein